MRRRTARPVEGVAVVIPARNEAATIDATVRSVMRAVDVIRGDVIGVSLVVVADGCDDDTAALARQHLGATGVAVERNCASVGHARRIGTELALELLTPAPAAGLWVASTDADTTVPPSWLRRQLDLARSGVDAVAGIVELADPDDALRSAFERHYRTSAARGSHPHVHGANLGIRADALASVGGWPALASGEDQDLWDRVGAAGHERLHDAGLVVSTSPRTIGRAPDGFAADLAQLRRSSGSLVQLRG